VTDAGTNEGARGSSWAESDAGETVAVAHAESSRSVVVDDEVVGAAGQWSQGPDDSRAGRRTVSDGTTDEVVVATDASITNDDETVVVTAAAAVDKSTTDGDRTIVEGDESVVVNEMFDELTKVDGSAVDDVSDRDGANDTVFSYSTVSFDQIWRASVSITKEAADIASKPNNGVDAPSQKYAGCDRIRQQISIVRVTGLLTDM